MRAALHGFYWRWQRRLVPGLRPSQYAFAETLTAAVGRGRRWLDVGCGRRPVPAWVPEPLTREVFAGAESAVGVDLDLDSLRDHQVFSHRVQAAAGNLPFGSATFDVVTANMVMEHVADPVRMLWEVRRVLRPGGQFVFHTPCRRYWAIALARWMPEAVKAPTIRVLEGRAARDVFPTHYRFNDVDAIRAAAHEAGFDVEQLDAVSSSAVLAAAGPLAIPELLWIRRLQRPGLATRRSNLIGVLRAPAVTI